jgi:uncharacterized membrane protein
MADKGASPGSIVQRELAGFASRRFTKMIRTATDRLADFGDELEQAAGQHGDAVTGTVKEAAQALLPTGGGKLGEIASSAAQRLSGGKGGQPRKATSIIEEVDVGVPVRTAYDQWTQFTQFPEFAKGVKRVEQQADEKLRWGAKVFWSKREWTSEITEQIPDKRIAWTSQGPKGSIDGVVTFHELAPELTKVLLALEYSPRGLFEHVGNIWRAQGRRVRLDLKRFRSYVMQRGEATGAWRGEIHDGEVVPEDERGQRPKPEEGPAGEDQKGRGQRRGGGEQREEQSKGKDADADARRDRAPASRERDQRRSDREQRRQRREGDGKGKAEGGSDEADGKPTGGADRRSGADRAGSEDAEHEPYPNPEQGGARDRRSSRGARGGGRRGS